MNRGGRLAAFPAEVAEFMRIAVSPVSLLYLAFAVILGVSLFNHGPIPAMEPRFADAVREMIAQGQYLIPTINHVPYIEYPPLYYWLSIAGRLAGLPLAAAIRLPTYLAFFLWLFWLRRLQRQWFPEWSAVLLPLTAAALPAVLYNFFHAQVDGLLMLGTLMAFTGFARLRTDPARRTFPWELWLGILLATAAKGPVGMAITLPAMALEVMLASCRETAPATGFLPVWNRRLRQVFHEAWRMAPFRGLGLALLGIVPWYLAAGLTSGWEFVRGVLVYQNFTRFLHGLDHLQPWWFYGGTIWGDFFPLALLVPVGLYLGMRHWREFRWRMPLLWALVTILFFSFSASKQSKYILPAAPAVAMLALATVPVLCNHRWQRRVFALLKGWAALFIAFFGALVLVWLPTQQLRIGGVGGYHRIQSAIAAHPGKIVSFQWPRPMTIYMLGAPLAWVTSSRVLYAEMHDGHIQAGDYVLVSDRFLPGGGEPASHTLLPAPAPPYLEKVLSVKAEKHMTLYRVLPGVRALPLPATPPPPPRHWWDQFDTD